MKSLLSLALLAVLVGVGLGAAWAYLEVPAVISPRLSTAPKTPRAQQAADLPRAKVPETEFNFGSIEQGASMSHTFKIKNEGKALLQLEVQSTTCKCTVGNLTTNQVAPGEEAEVLLEWIAKTPPGPFRHGAVLSSSDPQQSSITLTVEGQVVESTALSPTELIFGTVKQGESSTADLYLMDFLDQDLKILSYEISDAQLKEDLEIRIVPAAAVELPAADATGGLRVSATYHARNMLGPLRGWLTLRTNLEKAEKLTVPFVGTVVGDISIFGPGWSAPKGLLRMGAFSGKTGKQVLLKVAIRGKDAQQLQLQVAQVDPPQLQAVLGEPQQMSESLLHIPLVVELPAGTQPLVRLGEPVSSDAEIVLRFKQEENPAMRLRVQFAVE
jgi:hypothetical protein